MLCYIFLGVKIKDSIQRRAEIGVIFLSFNLGLEFSFKKMMIVRGAASDLGSIENRNLAGMILLNADRLQNINNTLKI